MAIVDRMLRTLVIIAFGAVICGANFCAGLPASSFDAAYTESGPLARNIPPRTTAVAEHNIAIVLVVFDLLMGLFASQKCSEFIPPHMNPVKVG